MQREYLIQATSINAAAQGRATVSVALCQAQLTLAPACRFLPLFLPGCASTMAVLTLLTLPCMFAVWLPLVSMIEMAGLR